jgi:hypothetical protein
VGRKRKAIVRFSNIREAIQHAESGGISLHVWKHPRGYPHDIPKCFEQSESWGHLFCQKIELLERVARRFGVRNVVVSKIGKLRQHVDLCGKPLEKAIEASTFEEQTCLLI